MLSQAAAYLRWLAGIDAIAQRGGAPRA
ncbi:hypothetical protein HNQ71_006236 [Mesorhizobium sangaii]|uniref:Uncharacterized protein n=1 Tax=Mesorhizobium sangaii TaxID=505389 RepID=A0A841PU18_9HYPH|nr:hypothetical protein [Mesorhizobium sangaii]